MADADPRESERRYQHEQNGNGFHSSPDLSSGGIPMTLRANA